MSSMKSARKQMFVDPKVQGALARRVVLYWATFLFNVFMMLLCWRIVTGPARMFYTHLDDMWYFYGPVFLVSLLFLPLVVIDIIRLSNRFAGPMVRLRRAMRELARGEHVEPIRFRDDDFWHDFAEEFNAVAARVQEESPQSQSEPKRELVGAAVDDD
jgi:hypothetical protein